MRSAICPVGELGPVIRVGYPEGMRGGTRLISSHIPHGPGKSQRSRDALCQLLPLRLRRARNALPLSEFPVTTCFEASFAFERSPFIDGSVHFELLGTHEMVSAGVLTSREGPWSGMTRANLSRTGKDKRPKGATSGVVSRKRKYLLGESL